MKRARHFIVEGRFNGARRATVTIDAHGTFRVRPYRRRRSYDVPLADVAAWAIWERLCRERPALRNLKPRGRR